MEFLSNSELGEFLLKTRNQYPALSRKAVLFLIPFITTYLCETRFSAMVTVKNKFHSKPKFSSLVTRMQQASSFTLNFLA